MSPEAPRETGTGHQGRLGEVVDFGREHLALLLVAGVVAIGIAVTYLTRAQAHTVPVSLATPVLVTPPASATAAADAGPAGSRSPSALASPRGIVVQVLGPVKRPGVITVPEGTRVNEAIARCGGLTAGADPGQLNLAAVLHDADQVVIGTRAEPGGTVRNDGAQPAGAGGAPWGSGVAAVDLNTATSEQLDQIPGIGPITAQKILDWREQHGRFTTVTELREIDGIGAKTFARIEPHVRV